MGEQLSPLGTLSGRLIHPLVSVDRSSSVLASWTKTCVLFNTVGLKCEKHNFRGMKVSKMRERDMQFSRR
jgi:hypothetical protein